MYSVGLVKEIEISSLLFVIRKCLAWNDSEYSTFVVLEKGE